MKYEDPGQEFREKEKMTQIIRKRAKLCREANTIWLLGNKLTTEEILMCKGETGTQLLESTEPSVRGWYGEGTG